MMERRQVGLPEGEHTQSLKLKATAQVQVTLDGHAAEMMDLEPLQVALVTTSPDRGTARKVDAQTVPLTGDRKSRQILAMATSASEANRLYVVEAVAFLGDTGPEEDGDNGEYLLWTLSSAALPIMKHDICTAHGGDCLYVAVRTAGSQFRDGVESSIYRIPLPAAGAEVE